MHRRRADSRIRPGKKGLSGLAGSRPVNDPHWTDDQVGPHRRSNPG